MSELQRLVINLILFCQKNDVFIGYEDEDDDGNLQIFQEQGKTSKFYKLISELEEAIKK